MHNVVIICVRVINIKFVCILVVYFHCIPESPPKNKEVSSKNHRRVSERCVKLSSANPIWNWHDYFWACLIQLDWLIDWLIDNLTDWLIDWFVDWLIYLIDWMIDQLIDWLTDSFWQVILATNIAESSITVPDIKYGINYNKLWYHTNYIHKWREPCDRLTTYAKKNKLTIHVLQV